MPKGFSVALIDMLTFPSGPFPTSLDVGVVPYVMKGEAVACRHGIRKNRRRNVR